MYNYYKLNDSNFDKKKKFIPAKSKRTKPKNRKIKKISKNK